MAWKSARFLPGDPASPNPMLLSPSCREATTCSTEIPVARTQEHPPTAPCAGAKNLLLAGISSWVHTYQSMRHRDPVQRAILLRNLWKLPGIQFNKFSPHYIIYWNKIPRAVDGFLVTENCKWLGLYFKFCYLSKALVCVALLNEWSLPDLWLDYNSPFWWVFY